MKKDSAEITLEAVDENYEPEEIKEMFSDPASMPIETMLNNMFVRFNLDLGYLRLWLEEKIFKFKQEKNDFYYDVLTDILLTGSSLMRAIELNYKNVIDRRVHLAVLNKNFEIIIQNVVYISDLNDDLEMHEITKATYNKELTNIIQNWINYFTIDGGAYTSKPKLSVEKIIEIEVN